MHDNKDGVYVNKVNSSESEEPGTQARRILIKDEFWQAASLFPAKNHDAFLRTPSPSFSTLYPGLLESALQTLIEDTDNGKISRKQYASALAYVVELMQNADHDTLAQWLRVARKNDWSATPLQEDTP